MACFYNTRVRQLRQEKVRQKQTSQKALLKVGNNIPEVFYFINNGPWTRLVQSIKYPISRPLQAPIGLHVGV